MLLTFDSSTIAKYINLKYLQINCKLTAENISYKMVDFIFATSNVKEITFKYPAEEIHFLSPLQTIETIMVVKANSNKPSSDMAVLHSVFIKNTLEITCVENIVLVKSEVMKMINLKTIGRWILVFPN